MSSAFSAYFFILAEHRFQVLSEKGRLGSIFFNLSTHVCKCHTTLIAGLNIQFCLETFLQATLAVLKCFLVQKSNVIVTWPLWPCYFSMEENLSLPLGIMKFHNELPWHSFVQSFYCVFPHFIKFWNMSISSEKFFQWFLWKFLHVFSFWNSYYLDIESPQFFLNFLLKDFFLIFHALFFYSTFWDIFSP